MFHRYAVYYTPLPTSSLATFGATWLGWDSARGLPCEHPRSMALDIDTITQTPRKYGFHGTIKPPFHLVDGAVIDDLKTALADLCARSTPVPLAGLRVSRLGRFLALVPSGDVQALSTLAARVVQDLDHFRASPSDAELAKRRGRGLSPAQDANLVQWGYPYVLSEFRFHMTLTGRLSPELCTQTEAALLPLLDQIDLSPWIISTLTLLGEDDEGRFHQIQQYPLGGV